MSVEFEFLPLSENSITIKLGNEMTRTVHEQVRGVMNHLTTPPLKGIIDVVPAYTTVTVYFDPMYFYDGVTLPYEKVCSTLKERLESLTVVHIKKGKEVVIPVCYGEEFGPDLEEVAKYLNLTPKEVVSIHTSGRYDVYMLGFAPGFAYLGGMSERIATPRKKTPRLRIPVGSVGIASLQTGIYPIESPGGWQLIGKTPLPLFRPNHKQPSLLQIGDCVIFQSISKEEYRQLEEEYDGNSCYP
ncbi:5-oxoprolinase subunit PxpB [Bacillus sp. FJAT-47783]|uniref:5-oxoprolinase subunit PxpB n=1 Tax=Bacillus sp. FJAT-47783 TaxID=2922712 RepID=UPI001FADAC28|nr:5-oxoprolinase subunit PxpB [Bacillus sp. FJAT-47783]